jgi:hypothetical protein
MAKTKRRSNKRVRRTRRGGISGLISGWEYNKHHAPKKPVELNLDPYKHVREQNERLKSVKPTIKKQPDTHDPYTVDQHMKISDSIEQYGLDRKSSNPKVRANADKAHEARVKIIKSQNPGFFSRASSFLGSLGSRLRK